MIIWKKSFKKEKLIFHEWNTLRLNHLTYAKFRRNEANPETSAADVHFNFLNCSVSGSSSINKNFASLKDYVN